MDSLEINNHSDASTMGHSSDFVSGSKRTKYQRAVDVESESEDEVMILD